MYPSNPGLGSPTVPGHQPGVGVGPTPTPGTPPIIRTLPGHAFRPPRQGEKEKKRLGNPKLVSAYRKFARQFGRVTEMTDALDCVYGSLPEKIRKREAAKRHGKNPKLTDKLQLIYRHAADINVNDMMKCMVVENAKDYVIGKANKKHAEARKRYGIRGGYLSRLGKLPSVNI